MVCDFFRLCRAKRVHRSHIPVGQIASFASSIRAVSTQSHSTYIIKTAAFSLCKRHTSVS